MTAVLIVVCFALALVALITATSRPDRRHEANRQRASELAASIRWIDQQSWRHWISENKTGGSTGGAIHLYTISDDHCIVIAVDRKGELMITVETDADREQLRDLLRGYSSSQVPIRVKQGVTA
jgi:hypothetical protein